MPDPTALQTEADIYGFLARLWIAAPDEAALGQLQTGKLHEAWTQLGGPVPKFDSESQTLDKLTGEYRESLLTLEDQPPPHQSATNDNGLEDDCFESLNQFVDIIGQPNGSLFEQQKDRDHAGVLLALMQRVCAYGAQCDADDAEAVAELRSQFFDAHLVWLIDYCEVAMTRTESSFYNGLFKVTANFLSR
ncbi:TorD/DmsD family molecular chaperone [Mariniblastus fucicola]|uniref:Chaperone protein TorD n=1 Tax=Mariniblastus fucicola TaxID=980251 RepID=A0A5B9PHP7_9BACT|nr:hypothetical protein [Mariniblastus fucicola]QEG24176.1 chaperone protein TorD [Mariniblastus fucicola]